MIVQIPLPDGGCAYARVLRDASIGVLRLGTSWKESVAAAEPYLFVVGVYDDVLSRWPVVGEAKFTTPEEEWPPPCAVIDKLTGQPSVYHHGELRPSTPEEAAGLEPAAVWDEHNIVRRIVAAN
jgi:hypothetical protein